MGYDVKMANSAHEALALLDAKARDLMVLDLSLPDMDGVELMDRARHLCPDLLIIVLTGDATLETAIAAVKCQAVAYLVKPTSPQEVAEVVGATLQKQARRVQERVLVRALGELVETLQPVDLLSPPSVPYSAAPDLITVPPLSLNLRDGIVVVNGDSQRACSLTRSEVDLLAALMKQAGQVLSTRDLAAAIHGLDPGERAARGAVTHHIHRLRRKIESNPAKPRLIRTVRSQGYVFLSDNH